MVIEFKDQLNIFLDNIKDSELFIHPILSDNNIHVMNNRLSMLYVYDINNDVEYVLLFNHSENIFKDYDIGILGKINNKKIFILDKKNILHLNMFENSLDLNLMLYLSNKDAIPFSKYHTNTHLFYYRNYFLEKNINDIIPIMKHLESCTLLKNYFLKYFDTVNILESKPYQFYNSKVFNIFQQIEHNGIFVDKENFKKYFSDKLVFHPIDENNIVYSEYNLYTSTGRPSNRFGSINFSSLNKNNNERSAFVSRFKENGLLIEFDCQSYHLRLISNLINYKLESDVNIHEYLGKIILDVDQLNEEEYNQIKQLNFQLLYGGIPNEFKNIEFFRQTDEYINELYWAVKKTGYITSKIFKHKIYIGSNYNKQKIFNYFLQNYETERNILVMNKLLKYLTNKNSKLIMYNYDSFILDMYIPEIKENIKEIKNIIGDNNSYSISIKYGKDYNILRKINN